MDGYIECRGFVGGGSLGLSVVHLSSDTPLIYSYLLALIERMHHYACGG